MFNLVGLALSDAQRILEEKGCAYNVITYKSRFKADVLTDSQRVVRCKNMNDNSIEIIVSDFKTNAQG